MQIQVNKKTNRIEGIIYFPLTNKKENKTHYFIEIVEIPQDWKYCFYIDNKIVLDEELKMSSMLEEIKNNIREHRNLKCFPIINRGQLWYDSLSEMQIEELRVWYQAWLDAPSTLEEPAMPDWI